MMMIGEVVEDLMGQLRGWAPERMPVQNSEERVQIDARLWHLIHERDSGLCWICHRVVQKGAGEIDHLVPRSAFAAADVISVADRSWNLRLACVACNQTKSNYSMPVLPRTLGITLRCWDCFEQRAGRPDPDFDPELTELWHEARAEQPILTESAYCGACGMASRVPGKEWIL